jgi:wyosine [tRNA(Phe)-imidazoG37] synthetase (radical SAM superfamily)
MTQSQNELVQRKSQLIKALEVQYDSWDRTTEHAVKLLDENNQFFSEIKEIDEKLDKETKLALAQKHKHTWEKLVKQHKKMIETIKTSQTEIKEQMKQRNKKSKAVDDYIPKDQSMFVDRDV